MRTALSILLAAASALAAQSVPEFEAVSIHPCRPDTPRGRNGNAPADGPSEILSIHCQTVERLIQNAYDFVATGKLRVRANPVPIEGAPSWIKTERFTIEAKSETPQPRGVLNGPMMRRVLEDRFQLKIRRVPTSIPVYFLTVAKGGPKNLSPPKAPCAAWDFDHALPAPQPGETDFELCGMISRRIAKGSGEVDIRNTTLPNFAGQLSILAGRDVIDKTGIAGSFDIHVEIPLEDLTADSPAREPDAPNHPLDESALAFGAVRRLGLKLESGKGPGETLVIDHIERPSQN